MRVPLFIPTLLQALAWGPTNLLLRFFCHFTVVGRTHALVPSGTPLVLAANHRSEFDPIAVRAALPLFWRQAPLLYVTAPLSNFKKEKMNWRFRLYSSRWFFAAWGAYPALTKTGDYATALATHEAFLTQCRRCVLIFPEGKIVRAGDEPRIRGGVGYLALLPDTITVPVAISGFEGMSVKSFLRRSHHVRVVFGESYTSRTLRALRPATAEDTVYLAVARQLMGDITRVNKSPATPSEM